MGRGDYCRSGTKWTTDDFRSVSIPELRKQKALNCGYHGWSWRQSWGERKVVASISFTISNYDIKFRYNSENHDGSTLSVNQSIMLDRTPCNYGGERVWFLCGCGQRVTRLFLAPRRVACRHCLNLTYSSQVENFSARAFRRRDRFLEKLGGELIHIHVKPKNMHRRTWTQLSCRCLKESILGLGGRLDEVWN